ncbi:MAG: hypothetical protein WC876_07750 [Candidatus Thermoplasmatota archaeon]|jgi:hypothetical protein
MTALPFAIVLLLLGLAGFLAGSALAWGPRPLLGFTIGGAGTVALVVGAILARNAMIGRFVEGDGE